MTNVRIFTIDEIPTLDFSGGTLTLSDLARIGDTLEKYGHLYVKNVTLQHGKPSDWVERMGVLTDPATD